MSQECQVRAQFFRPPPQLQRYFTTFYYVEFATEDPKGAFDYLHPEWANLRFIKGCKPVATGLNGERIADTNFYVTGPSSRAVRFDFDDSIRMWGIGILPLRTVERVCNRAFGFSPKLLLRRQRFLRSLADYVLDPSLKWIGAMDSQYHDQAQFVRDFKQFMGMSPRQYAALDKPILTAVMRERARFAGKAVQALDSPAGGKA